MHRWLATRLARPLPMHQQKSSYATGTAVPIDLARVQILSGHVQCFNQSNHRMYHLDNVISALTYYHPRSNGTGVSWIA